MLITKKSQLEYDKTISVVKVSKMSGNKLSAVAFTGKAVAIYDDKFVIQLAGTGQLMDLYCHDLNMAKAGEECAPAQITIHRVFTTTFESTNYVNRINNMDLTPGETLTMRVDSAVELKYAVLIAGEIRQMPIEIKFHKVYNKRESKVIDGKTWWCDDAETRHSYTRNIDGAECDVSDRTVKVFFDPHTAIDFYLGK